MHDVWVGTAENRALTDAAERTAQATDALYGEVTGDMVTGQTDYCFPRVYKPKAFYVIDAHGKRQSLCVSSTDTLDGGGAGVWRTETAATPRRVIVAALNRFTVQPTPTATRLNALIVAGFILPPVWDKPGDVCPLPDWAHDAVVLKATATACRILKSKDRAYAATEAEYNRDYLTTCGIIAAQAGKLYRQGNP